VKEWKGKERVWSYEYQVNQNSQWSGKRNVLEQGMQKTHLYDFWETNDFWISENVNIENTFPIMYRQYVTERSGVGGTPGEIWILTYLHAWMSWNLEGNINLMNNRHVHNTLRNFQPYSNFGNKKNLPLLPIMSWFLLFKVHFQALY
jgi:hypothetical protein